MKRSSFFEVNSCSISAFPASSWQTSYGYRWERWSKANMKGNPPQARLPLICHWSATISQIPTAMTFVNSNHANTTTLTLPTMRTRQGLQLVKFSHNHGSRLDLVAFSFLPLAFHGPWQMQMKSGQRLIDGYVCGRWRDRRRPMAIRRD